MSVLQQASGRGPWRLTGDDRCRGVSLIRVRHHAFHDILGRLVDQPDGDAPLLLPFGCRFAAGKQPPQPLADSAH